MRRADLGESTCGFNEGTSGLSEGDRRVIFVSSAGHFAKFGVICESGHNHIETIIRGQICKKIPNTAKMPKNIFICFQVSENNNKKTTEER